MPDFLSISNQSLAGTLLSLAVATCFREQISKIESKHMAYSLWIAILFFGIGSLVSAVIHRLLLTATPSNIMDILNWQFLNLYSFAVLFSALTYHTTYRGLVLLFPLKQDRLWIFSAIFAAIEFAINMDATLFGNNLKATGGMIPDPNEQKTSITVIVYVVTVDTIFFFASQIKIITTMAQINKHNPTVLDYLDMGFRCICYSGSVFLFYFTAGGFAFSTQEGVFFSASPCIMFMVLLTDADRVRKLVASLKGGSSSTVTTGKSSRVGESSTTRASISVAKTDV
ncbi:hypothetical protein DFJ73DRAFT_859470 [Zopfochytrium polystomum]|nr:hypothetical protein DFJ73DRAFT_859470 [Zopfochytrium polystomum]